MTIAKLMAGLLKLPEQQVNDELTMRDCAAWDSLKHMELIVGLETHYGITLTGDEIAEMTSVRCIKEILKVHGVCS